MNRDVFISYSSRDRATADTIRSLLETRGVACWIAPRDVLPGRNYDEEILAGIENTSAIVILLSDSSNESHHVKRELELAINQGSAVLPIRIQDILPGRGLKYFLAGKQWVDAWEPPIESKMDDVSAAIKALSRGKPRVEPPGFQPAAGSVPTGRSTGPSQIVGPTHGSASARKQGASSGKPFRTLQGHRGPVFALVLSSDGRIALTGSNDLEVKVWDVASGTLLRILDDPDPVTSLALSHDGNMAISASESQLKVWDVNTGRLLRKREGHGTGRVVFTTDARFVVSAAQDLKVWSFGLGDLLHTLVGHDRWIDVLLPSSDGRTLVSASRDGTLKQWDLATGALLHTFDDQPSPPFADAPIFGAELTPDGRTIVAGSGDGPLKVWDLSSGKLLRKLLGHTDMIWSLRIGPDGFTVVSGSGAKDRTLKVWHLASTEPLRTLEGHADAVYALALTPDGQTVVSGSNDRTVKVWNIQSGRLVTTFADMGRFPRLALTPDGRSVIVGDDLGRLHFLEVMGTENGDARQPRFEGQAGDGVAAGE